MIKKFRKTHFCGTSEKFARYLGNVATRIEVKDAWVKRTQSAEHQAILQDENHKRYDEVEELVLEAWWEVEGAEIEKALAQTTN